MIILVYGHPRSGTCATCGAMDAGGWPIAYDPSCDAYLHETYDTPTYRFNPGSAYEFSPSARANPDWPAQYDGCTVKLSAPWTASLSARVSDYRVIVLHRDTEEIRQSFAAAFRKPLSARVIEGRFQAGLEMLANRRDVRSIDVQYRDLVFDPEIVFAAIRDELELPRLDVAAAAATIDPAHYRARLERLHLGA